MNPGDKKTLIIARRTKKNLEYVDALKAMGVDFEEITHLLNSMLGMLICLREEYFKGKNVTWNDVKSLGLEPLRIEQEDLPDSIVKQEKSKHFSQLITKLRNGFAHNNFELVGNPITHVRIWNIEHGKENQPEFKKFKNWQVLLSEDELRKIAHLFIEYLEEKHGQDLPIIEKVDTSSSDPKPTIPSPYDELIGMFEDDSKFDEFIEAIVAYRPKSNEGQEKNQPY